MSRFDKHPAVEKRLQKLESALEGHTRSAASITRSLTPDAVSRGFKTKEKAKVDLAINFAFNSSEMDRSGLKQAHELGKSLSGATLRNASYQVIGHTDAVGARDYNQKLSQSRAKVVRAFLIRNYQLDPSQLEWIGRGEDELLIQDSGDNRSNRRVEVRLK